MFDLLSRILKHPFNYLGGFRVNELELINKTEVASETWCFEYKKPTGLKWHTGQHSAFFLPGRKVQSKKWRVFSVTSSVHEETIKIATRIPEKHTDFKEKLLNLEPGDKVKMFGPVGEFYAKKKTKHIIGVAAGIGITPFRALAYDIKEGCPTNTKMTLIYYGQVLPFKDELDEWARDCVNLEIIYGDNRQEQKEILERLFNQHGNKASYFISGAPAMVDTVINQCKEMGVKKIVNDPFKGY